MSNTFPCQMTRFVFRPRKSAGLRIEAVYVTASMKSDQLGHFCATNKEKGVA